MGGAVRRSRGGHGGDQLRAWVHHLLQSRQLSVTGSIVASTATTVRYTAPGGDSHRDTRARVLTGSTAVYLAATSGQPRRARARALRAFAKAAEARPKPSTPFVCAPRRDASSVTKTRRCLGLWVHAAGVPDLLLGRFAHVGHWLLHKSSACPVLAPGSFICFFQAQSAVAA